MTGPVKQEVSKLPATEALVSGIAGIMTFDGTTEGLEESLRN